ncbi:hypothetical protein N431DRAFT_440512 [Stipitochalara longipes BDJ]|nr:hypothetical protein N431DRAFT_440512 [Stipitochalara longipes BDJ]
MGCRSQETRISSPHGYYILKPELYGILKPEVYPFEDEVDRDYVINKVRDYQEPAQPQGLVQRPRIKRSIVTDSDDEELHKAAKKTKTDTDAHNVQGLADDTSSDHSRSEPCSPVDSVSLGHSPGASPDISETIDLEPEFEHDLDSSLQPVGESSLLMELEGLTKNKRKLQEKIKDVDNLKSKVLQLQQDVSMGKAESRKTFERTWANINDEQSFIQEKDKQIKQLRSSNSEKDLQLSDFKEALRKANTTIQSQIAIIRALQSQQQLSEKEAQIRKLNFVFSQERYLRAAAERGAKEANEKYRYLLNRGGVGYQTAKVIQEQLDDVRSELKAAQLREETNLAEDERKLRERRAAMMQRGSAEDSQ